MLDDASTGDSIAFAAVFKFATTDAAAAWFDPNRAFSVSEFTEVGPPVGGRVPEPAVWNVTQTARLSTSLRINAFVIL